MHKLDSNKMIAKQLSLDMILDCVKESFDLDHFNCYNTVYKFHR